MTNISANLERDMPYMYHNLGCTSNPTPRAKAYSPELSPEREVGYRTGRGYPPRRPSGGLVWLGMSLSLNVYIVSGYRLTYNNERTVVASLST